MRIENIAMPIACIGPKLLITKNFYHFKYKHLADKKPKCFCRITCKLRNSYVILYQLIYTFEQLKDNMRDYWLCVCVRVIQLCCQLDYSEGKD